MKSADQLRESIDRFQRVFWDKRSDARPPVGVLNPEVFLPVKYLRTKLGRAELSCGDVTPGLALSDYEFGFARAAVTVDDFLPFSAPWRAIPWLEAICGCPVRCAAGSLGPGHPAATLAALETWPIPADRAWLERLAQETARVQAEAPADCWTSPTILRGSSDVLAALRGLSEFYCDLYDDMELIDRAAGRIHRLFLDALERHFSLVRPKCGGYGHIFGYWAPAPTIVIQEDVLGSCSPAVYRDHFAKYSADVVKRLGACVLFHLHSTGCAHWRDVLAVPGLAGLELTVEANGPAIEDLLPMFRTILERSRLILCADAGIARLPEVIRQLPREGLYVLLRQDDVPTNADFRRLVSALWA